MSDTITKDEARRLIEDIYLREARDMLCVSNGIEAGTILNERVTKALQELEQMPSAQQWIPASKPPKEDGRYLVLYDWGESGYYHDILRYNTTDGDIFKKGWNDMSMLWNGLVNHEIDLIAWMPLPEPYKEET